MRPLRLVAPDGRGVGVAYLVRAGRYYLQPPAATAYSGTTGKQK